MMNRFVLMVLAACLLIVCSCNQQEADTPAVEYSPLAGSDITVGGETVTKVMSVGDFDTNTKSLAGLVAIEGRVSESVADMHTFILVDSSNKPGCESTCCSTATVPVRLAAGGYTGDLPKVGESVIVIGDLTLTETGYLLDVFEARRGSETLLKKT